jgi:hypothetical protein
MHGVVTAYDSGTGALTVNVEDIGGSGTLSDWNITIAGTRGPAGVATIADGDKGDIITSGSGTTWTFDWTALTSVVYVAKTGSDANAGTLPHKPKLTIAAANTAAAALITGGVTKSKVVVLDEGVYTEDVTLSANVSLEAPGATIVGQLVLGDASYCYALRSLFSNGNNVNGVLDLGSSGSTASQAWIGVIDGRGTGGTNTGNICIRNNTSGRVLMVTAGQVVVGQDGYGIRDSAAGGGFGHVHFRFGDLYLAGNNATGIRSNNANTWIVGFLDHILESGSPTGTTGVYCTDASAIISVVAAEIVADTVYNISAGNCYVVCPRMSGAFTGTVSSVPHVSSLEIGNASDATLSRNAAGLLQVETNIIPHVAYAATWSAPQTASSSALTSSVAADFSTKQVWTAAVSGAFTISNPSADPASGTYVAIVISMTAAGAVSWGNKFKGLANYTQSTWASGTMRDHLTFRFDGTNYDLVGVAKGANQ